MTAVDSRQTHGDGLYSMRIAVICVAVNRQRMMYCRPSQVELVRESQFARLSSLEDPECVHLAIVYTMLCPTSHGVGSAFRLAFVRWNPEPREYRTIEIPKFVVVVERPMIVVRIQPV